MTTRARRRSRAPGRTRRRAGGGRAGRVRQPAAARAARAARPDRPGRGARHRARRTARCAGAAAMTRCSPCAATATWRRSTRRCARCSGSARTSCSATRVAAHAAVGHVGHAGAPGRRSPPGRVRQRRAPPGGDPRPQRAGCEIAAPDRASDPAGHLAVRHSHPRWIVEAFAAALGEALDGPLAQTEAVLAADNERPRVHVCVLPGRADQAELIAAGCDRPAGPRTAATWPRATRRASPRWRPGGPGVQDEASQLAAIAVSRAGAGGGRRCRCRSWRALARPVRGPGRQGAHARGPGHRRRRPAGRRRAARAPGPAGPARDRGRRDQRGRRGRRHPAGLAGRRLQPGARRRALHRPRRAAPAPGGPLAARPRRRGRACRRCSGSCCGRRWTPPRRAAWSGT